MSLPVTATLAVLWLVGVPVAHAAIPPGAITDNLIPTANAYGCYDSTQANSNHVCQTDNRDVSWWINDSDIDTTASANDTPAETNINTTMKNSYDGTDLHTYYDTTPVTTGSGETDVVYVSRPGAFTQANQIGFTWCDDAITGSNYACDQQYVNFRNPQTTNRALACHETGHAVGLVHGDDADPQKNPQDSRLNCMVAEIDANLRFLDDNNVANINFVY